MLDAYIIEELKRRREERRHEERRPVLEITVDEDRVEELEREDSDPDEEHHGVIIIDYGP